MPAAPATFRFTEHRYLPIGPMTNDRERSFRAEWRPDGTVGSVIDRSHLAVQIPTGESFTTLSQLRTSNDPSAKVDRALTRLRTVAGQAGVEELVLESAVRSDPASVRWTSSEGAAPRGSTPVDSAPQLIRDLLQAAHGVQHAIDGGVLLPRDRSFV